MISFWACEHEFMLNVYRNMNVRAYKVNLILDN